MAALVKQPLLPEFDAMERRFRRMFEGMPMMSAFMPSATPAADVYETPEEYIVEIEVPGYDEKELGIEVSDHTLTIKGAREETKEEAKKTFRLHERLERSFERTFVLPSGTDGEHVRAQFAKGVLKVYAPKLSTTKPRTVAISKT